MPMRPGYIGSRSEGRAFEAVVMGGAPAIGSRRPHPSGSGRKSWLRHRAAASIRSPSRSSSIACTPSSRRWARRCCAPPTRRSSTPAATSRPRICDADGRLVAQAEHVPIHVGALPWAAQVGGRVLQGAHPAGRRLSAERSLPRRQSSARPHRLRAGVRRRPAAVLVDQPLAPERHRRRHPRRLQPRRHRDLAGGHPHSAAPALRSRAGCATTCSR